MVISEETIKAVRDLPIEDVLSDYIKLKKNEAPCPFHNEKTASFRITPSKNLYHCFGCHAGGDAIKFVQDIKKLTFIEAIELIARMHEIPMEYTGNDNEEERKAKISKLEEAKQILSFAHNFYRKALRENQSIKETLYERGLADKDIEYYQIGYAPDDFKNLTPSIINNDWFDVAVEIGLIATSKGQNFDTYRNRFIIPISDKHGQLIGFGGRLAGGEGPKYINPNENFLYSKSTVLYGLDMAAKAINEHKETILVEGYFDVISMQLAGTENVVAPCGTACDEKQLQLLKRYSNKIVIMYDGDKAGQTATEKVIHKAVKLGMDVLVAELDGQDPDELARNYKIKSKDEKRTI